MQVPPLDQTAFPENDLGDVIVVELDLVDAKEACRILGGSRPINPATLYRGVADGRFPAPIKLGRGTSWWVKRELRAAIEKRMAARKAVTFSSSAPEYESAAPTASNYRAHGNGQPERHEKEVATGTSRRKGSHVP